MRTEVCSLRCCEAEIKGLRVGASLAYAIKTFVLNKERKKVLEFHKDLFTYIYIYINR